MSYPVHGSRALLNPPGHQITAAIVAEVENTADWKPGKDREGEKLSRWCLEPECNLRISDCDRAIGLEFEFGDAGDRAASLEKVDTLIKVLREFRKGLAVEIKRYEHRLTQLPPEGGDE